MASLDRLKNLYGKIGLSTKKGTYNLAEIMAYCAGIDMVSELLNIDYDREHISVIVPYDWSEFRRRYGDVADSFDISLRHIIIHNSAIDTGDMVDSWISPFVLVEMGGTGKSWNALDDEWIRIDNKKLRWSMIDTLEEDYE